MAVARTSVDWQPMPRRGELEDARQGASVGDEWTDFSGAGVTMVDIASRDCARLGGGSEAYPARVRYRIAPSRPSQDDRGEVLEIIGDAFRRLAIPSGQRLWLRADTSSTSVIVEVTGMVR